MADRVMNPVLRKAIEGLVGIIVIIIFLRLLLVPTYAFMNFRNEPLMVMLMIPEAVLSGFIAYKVVRYIHRYL
jgi:carbon starvation protein CstA